MDWPAEIRNRIYELVLVREKDTDISLWPQWAYRPQAAEVSGLKQPPLTQVNRAIRKDTLPIVYGCNTIIVSLCRLAGVLTATRWLRSIGPSNRKLLRKCCMHYDPLFPPGLNPRQRYLEFANRYEARLSRDGVVAKIGDLVHMNTEDSESAQYGRLTFEDEGAEAE